jgi:hypothetical protein
MADVPALLDDHMSRLHPTFPGLLSKHLPVLRRALFDNEDDREVVQVDLDEAVGMLKTELRLNTEVYNMSLNFFGKYNK